jgi:carboxymethylenebutenolidase
VVPLPGLPVQYGRGKATTVGYLASAGDPTGGVVVVHDRYGALPHLRARCELLARSGMTALAPDLYGGRFTIDEAEAARLAGRLDHDLAITRLVGAVEYLRRRGVERLGLLGFSVGGDLVLHLATGVRVDAIATYYAALPSDAWVPIECPMQFHLAEVDEFDPPELPEAFAEWLIASGTEPVETFHYPGTRHGFANPDVAAYRPGSSELAWARTVRFLGSHLIWEPP